MARPKSNHSVGRFSEEKNPAACSAVALARQLALPFVTISNRDRATVISRSSDRTNTRFLAQSQELCDLLKASHFQKIYLPVENVSDEILISLNRKHVKLRHVIEAAKKLEQAGFPMRHNEVNGYCLYGLPGEKIETVVQTALFVSDVIGSVIPMLFAPVPSTQLFEKYLGYYAQRGWCEQDGTVRDLHLLNGKLFPFIHMNEGTIGDYINLQRMMFMLNENYRGQSFNVFGDGAVSQSFRSIVGGSTDAAREAPRTGADYLEPFRVVG